MARKKIFAVYDGETHLGDYTAVEAAPPAGNCLCHGFGVRQLRGQVTKPVYA